MGKIGNAVKLLRRGRPDILLAEVCKVFHLPIPTPRFPSSLMMEPTNACNLRCPTCPTGAGKLNRPKRAMKLEEFKGIIEQAKGRVESVVLWNYGEPFLNKHILEMVAFADTASIETIVSTNGHFLPSLEYCKKVVASGLKKLIVCLDGLDQETMSRFRGKADIEEVLRGMKYMLEAKAELGSVTPEIQLQFILMKYNQHQKEDVRRLALELGVDVFCVKPVGIDANDPDFERMAAELLPDDLSDSHYERDAQGRVTVRGKVPNYCWWLDNVMVINSDGDVVACCYDLYSAHIMGNAFKQSLAQIWNGPAYQQFRKTIRRDRKSVAICKTCVEGRTLARHEEKLTASQGGNRQL
jgi:radical SAM protein with 4Fe4S-binding SPASM domain